MQKFIAVILVALVATQVSAAPRPDWWTDLQANVQNAAKNVGNTFNEIGARFGFNFDDLNAIIKNIATALKGPFKSLADTLKTIKDNALQSLASTVQNGLQALSDRTDGKLKDAIAATQTLVGTFQTSASSLIDRYANEIDGDINALNEQLKAQGQACRVTYQPQIDSLKDSAIESVQSCGQAARTEIEAVVAKVQTIVEDVPESIQALIQELQDCALEIVGKTLNAAERSTAFNCLNGVKESLQADVKEIEKRVTDLRPVVEADLKNAALNLRDCGVTNANVVGADAANLLSELTLCASA